MPFRFEEAVTPKGDPLLLLQISARVTLADAEHLEKRLGPGGPNHKWLILAPCEKGTEFDAAARKHFAVVAHNRYYRAIAPVVTSPITRAAINMIIRLIGDVPNVRLFSDEPAALAWLDAF